MVVVWRVCWLCVVPRRWWVWWQGLVVVEYVMVSDDSNPKIRKAFILNHDDTITFCCRLDPSTCLGKDSFEFVLITEILAHD